MNNNKENPSRAPNALSPTKNDVEIAKVNGLPSWPQVFELAAEPQEPNQPHPNQDHEEAPSVDLMMELPHRRQASLHVGRFHAEFTAMG